MHLACNRNGEGNELPLFSTGTKNLCDTARDYIEETGGEMCHECEDLVLIYTEGEADYAKLLNE